MDRPFLRLLSFLGDRLGDRLRKIKIGRFYKHWLKKARMILSKKSYVLYINSAPNQEKIKPGQAE